MVKQVLVFWGIEVASTPQVLISECVTSRTALYCVLLELFGSIMSSVLSSHGLFWCLYLLYWNQLQNVIVISLILSEVKPYVGVILPSVIVLSILLF